MGSGSASTPIKPAETVEAEAIISDIMKRHGVRCSLEEFHAALNITFHDFESEVYDQEHSYLWDSLPLQFALLVQDCLPSWPEIPARLRLLDIGCGTGLASDCILKTAVGARVESIDLLDTSAAMLRRASERASRWGARVAAHEGTVESLPQEARYDLIVTCSVLHHIPDLPRFLNAVRDHQAPGGVFLHAQDPNADYADDPELRQRRALLQKRALPAWATADMPRRIVGRVHRALTGAPPNDYIWKTNQILLGKGIITTPLSVEDIFAVTDIHVNKRVGISIKRMQSWMTDYDCVSVRSYDFFGAAGSLPPRYKGMEQDLIGRRAPNGAEVAAAWKLKQ
jgi:2-polyprenyl-3-methyl-5-hydroxy-6-metoxy-1,4-benzoquinol methylase